MTWQSIADKQVNIPVVLVEVAFDSGTRYYSTNYVATPTQLYKGSIISLPILAASVGDITRSFERSTITIVFDDTDYEFRGLDETESPHFKNRVVTIKVAFADDDYATPVTVYVGQIFDWKRLGNLQYEFSVEEKSKNIENKYPDLRVNRVDYPNADASAVGWIIPIPYGEISALGGSGTGAFGHPSLSVSGSGGCLLVDNTLDAEKHLVGRQSAAITVDRVYLDGVLQTEGVGNDYQISTQVIDGQTHTEIHWEAGVNPTNFNKVSCDITFGSRRPVDAIRHFLESFCGYVAGDFNAAAYTAATDRETDRGYDFAGCLWKEEELRVILDTWRNQWELDIYYNPDGEIVFNYITAVHVSPNKYNELTDILEGDENDDPQVDQLMNKLEYGYNYDWGGTYYYNQDTYEDTDSQTKHGGTFRQFIGFQWTRLAAVAHDIASRKVVRFKDPITFVTYKFPLKTYTDSLTDMLRITHFGGKGSSGYVDRLFQIRAQQEELNGFTNTMKLEDASNFAGNACILGDELVLPLTWTSATEAQQVYCYLGDSGTKQFSDGKPAKRMFD